jgi:hypothetical protein
VEVKQQKDLNLLLVTSAVSSAFSVERRLEKRMTMRDMDVIANARRSSNRSWTRHDILNIRPKQCGKLYFEVKLLFVL